MENQKKWFSALVSNILPIIGVLFFNWSVFSLLLSYWLENIAIGFYQVLKMKRATSNYPVNEQNKMIPGPLRPVKPAEKIFSLVFFCVHYGLFCGGHLIFLYFFGAIVGDPIHFTPFILISSIPFFITHGKDYLDGYVANKEYETTPLAKLFFSPYRRIVTMHLIITIGALPILLAAAFASKITVVLIVLKIIFDFKVEQKSVLLAKEIDAGQIKTKI